MLLQFPTTSPTYVILLYYWFVAKFRLHQKCVLPKCPSPNASRDLSRASVWGADVWLRHRDGSGMVL